MTAVIVDDGGYGMLRFDQDLKGDPHEGVDLHTPDFVALARSFGVRADEVDGLGERFEAMLGHHLRLERADRARGEGGAAPAAERIAPLVSEMIHRARRDELLEQAAEASRTGLRTRQQRIITERPADPALGRGGLAGLAGRHRGGRPPAARSSRRSRPSSRSG